ncbi:threonine-phosphate decarboxylase CobD [Marinobacterium arenosum]|uniref:threonine-phosphate decarboxylase CobD n=1 Tax=Marinobacterium arenosum TaxID=2862496 RepID=UPI001C97FBF9|nr:threonine-phosphate decarboxylase CobD [Marinobacterium arenosum]MBY4676045.1 threonine-phosphate decarboxylase CobD [Marinobacterium arenosum]
MQHQHGGQLRAAAERYGIAPADWLDLSTGINPLGWPVPPIPAEVFNRLPEPSESLERAASDYYGNASLLHGAGSQPFIQTLPQLRPPGRVGLAALGYYEHRKAWQQAGHQLVELATEQIDAALAALDVLLLINPNNPTGQRYCPQRLLAWHRRLAARGGWLLVDEAFIDSRPDGSLLARIDGDWPDGLIVLRSVGKFFGLAGIRSGFMFASVELRQRMAARLGPWAVSHPAQWLTGKALADRDWQREARQRLAGQGARLQALLSAQGWYGVELSGTDYFCTLSFDCAERAGQLHRQLAENAILTRLFDQAGVVRFGLPAREADWQRLAQVLARLSVD